MYIVQFTPRPLRAFNHNGEKEKMKLGIKTLPPIPLMNGTLAQYKAFSLNQHSCTWRAVDSENGILRVKLGWTDLIMLGKLI